MYGAQIIFHGGDLKLSTVVSFETTQRRPCLANDTKSITI